VIEQNISTNKHSIVARRTMKSWF